MWLAIQARPSSAAPNASKYQMFQDTRDVALGSEQTLSAEPFLLAGTRPADEASFVLVEEALTNAIRELEIIQSFSRAFFESAFGQRFSSDGASSDEVLKHQRDKERQIRTEISEIFASEKKQRALIEQRIKKRESLRNSTAELESPAN